MQIRKTLLFKRYLNKKANHRDKMQCTADKGLASMLYKELLQFNSMKTNI